ncbi:MAG TPA: IclR family transcriptional regulator [Mycobacteriales bacterium]|nr:IclR family transcriptional regulator [Mycobacteriales bacterium]
MTSRAGGPAAGGSGTVQSVDRALLLLEVLAHGGGRLPLTELAARSGLPLGTVHRLLAALAARGYVRQDPDRRYALGTSLLPLGDAATRLLGSWALPFLHQLAAQVGETVNLAVLEDDHVVYVAQAPGRHRMRMFTEVGRRALPHSTAVGKVLLAWYDDDHVRRVVSRLGLPARTARTLVDLPAFAAELATVRSRGWAVDDEEEEVGVRCLAVPIGPGPGAVAAISVSAPASRLDRDAPDVVAALQRAGAELAASLTARG